MLTYFLKKYHPTGFHYMSVVLVHKAGFFCFTQITMEQVAHKRLIIIVL